MASRPFLQQVVRHINAMGGDEWFFGRIADGALMADIARDVGCSRNFLYTWLKLDPERKGRLALARVAAATSIAEDGLEILDNLDGNGMVSSVDVSLARERAGYRKWLASVYDKDQFADRKSGDVNLSLSIGTMHLDALRQKGTVEVIEEAEVTLIEGESDHE